MTHSAATMKSVEKPDSEDDEAEDAAEEPEEVTEASDGEDRVNESEDFVSDDDPESPAALERR